MRQDDLARVRISRRTGEMLFSVIVQLLKPGCVLSKEGDFEKSNVRFALV
jgi:hypothetical protein